MRPMLRCRTRFPGGPSSTVNRLTTSRSTSSLGSFCCAFVTADFMSFSRSRATSFRENRSRERASPTFFPRTVSAIRRVFCAETPRYRSLAVAITFRLRASLGWSRRRGGTRRDLRRLVAPRAVALERPRRRELPELVPHHVLGHVDRDELLAVVHRECVTDHLRDQRGPPGPGLDHLLLEALVQVLHLLAQVDVDELTLRDRPRHASFPRLLPPPDDERVRARVVARLLPLRGNPPRGHRRPASGGLPLAAAVRMVDRVHGDAADLGPPSLPPVPSRLADALVLVLEVPDLADRGVAVLVDLPRLARREPHERPPALAGHELRAGAGGADELPAPEPLELDVVDRRARRDALERERVPHDDVRLGRRQHPGPHLEAARREDVPPLAVRVAQERDVGAPVRVVLDLLDLRGDAELVPAEIDDAVAALVAAPPVPDRDQPAVVPAARPVLLLHERLVRGVLRPHVEHERGLEPASNARGLVRSN